MKHIKLFENFEVVEPIRHGDELNSKEINYLKSIGFYFYDPKLIKKDDNYYYVYDHRCESIKSLPKMYISYICDGYGIRNYTINDDFSIDVDDDVYLNNSGIPEIPLIFNKVSEGFYCDVNILTSLKGSPKWVGGDFDCDRNSLTTLEGGPEYVGGAFLCRDNKLTTLEGAPKYVRGVFNCCDNPLISIDGIGEVKGGIFITK
jgi:hypothetical protein